MLLSKLLDLVKCILRNKQLGKIVESNTFLRDYVSFRQDNKRLFF